MAYNTGNPLGSTDPRDLSDNSENFDRAVNNLESATWTDRFGNSRTSLAGQIGYIGTGTNGAIESYASGLELTTYSTIIEYNGEFYRPSSSATLPYTTTATTPDVDSNLVAVGDAVLRQDLSNSLSGFGASLVSMEGGPTVEQAVNERVVRVGSVAELKTIEPVAGYQASIGSEKVGVWRFRDSNLSSEVAGDPSNKNYIAPDSDPTGASGAWVFIYGGRKYTLSPRKIADSSAPLGYDSEPQLALCNDSSIFCAYRRGDSHVGDAGRVVGKRSEDNGQTWGAEIEINNVAGLDTRNPTAGVDVESGRLIVFSRTIDATEAQVDVMFQTSDDNGLTWSATTSVQSLFSDTNAEGIVPFGAIVSTSNGLMQLFYASDATDVDRTYAYALFSTDGGLTWGGRVTVWDITSAAAQYSETCPVALDSDRIVIAIRDNRRPRLFAHASSSDGGLTWTTPDISSWFDTSTATEPTTAAPIWITKHSDSEIMVAWAARGPVWKLFTRKIGVEALWKNPWHAWWNFDSAGYPPPSPTIIDSSIIPNGAGATDTEFGYPCLLRLSSDGVLLAWHDSKDGNNATETDIWVTTAE